jgi:hypothetical protein
MNAIQAFVPPDIVKTIAAFLEFCYIARRNIITEGSLEQLDAALRKFHESRQVFAGTVREDGPSAFSLPRQHSMVHYCDHIKNFGSPNGLCSSITESKHITAVKRPWRRTNKHMALPQMLKINERLDKIAAARADFAARGMLVDSCFIQALKNVASGPPRNLYSSMDEDTSDSETESETSSDENGISEDECRTHDDERMIPDDGERMIPDNDESGTSDDGIQTLDSDNDSRGFGHTRVPRQPPQVLPVEEEDDDCGPIELGPLMNEVRLVGRKGMNTLGCAPRMIETMPTAPTKEYPTSLQALGLKIRQYNLLDLTRKFLFYQLNPTSLTEPDQLALTDCPMIWESKVSVYHSATAIFRAPSNPSGPGGMYREVIRSTPFWPRGDIPGPRRDCVFVDMGGSENAGMKGFLVARVFLFFRFSHGGTNYPCALVHWFSTSSEPDADTGLWMVEPEYIRQEVRHMSVVHIDSIVRGAHLLPRFPSDAPVYREINYANVLDVYSSFYVNRFIDHHAFEIAF